MTTISSFTAADDIPQGQSSAVTVIALSPYLSCLIRNRAIAVTIDYCSCGVSSAAVKEEIVVIERKRHFEESEVLRYLGMTWTSWYQARYPSVNTSLSKISPMSFPM
jgi:hypothetical protein